MKDKKRFFIRLATVLVLIGIAVLMYFLGRGHTVYFDNKKLEYDGVTYDTPYKVEVYVGGERVAKLYDKERGSATCMGGTFTVTLEIMQTKGGAEEVQTYKIPVPSNMDGVIINIPGYLAGLPQEAYLSEFVAAPSEETDEDVSTDDTALPGEGDDLIPSDM